MSLATDDADDFRAADRERRKRENELLLLLLLLCGEAERDARIAASHGQPVADVIRNVIVGGGFTGRTGAARRIARAMAQAHRDGFRRAGLQAGTREIERAGAGTLAELMNLYATHAQRMAEAMADTLSQRVPAAVAAAQAATDATVRYATRAKKAVTQAFEDAGYSRANPYAVDTGVERAIVAAHNGGIVAAASGGAEFFGAGGLGARRAVGLRHCSVIDNRTTEICRERDGLTLPADDPYWRTNIPSLHNRCRSMIRVITGDYDASGWRPLTQPAPGFGAAPPGLLESFARQGR